MQDKEQLLKYLQSGIDALLAQGCFDGGQPFRRTQIQALEAYKNYLAQENYTTDQKLKGFFEIPTGIGKTALFVGIVAAAHKAARADGKHLKTVIVVPTTQLLTQALEGFEGKKEDGVWVGGFAPGLRGQIGLYGDGFKDFGKAITIMTYNAWSDLSQSGEIGSHNVDILISDEAHRGTSTNRIKNLTEIFNAETAQIAFTATAHFDEQKSVQASHEREIFYKSAADAIREGELASYVQSQRLIIRANPDDFMLSDEFEKSSDERKSSYRRAARRNAWNTRALKIFREGRDERTKDPLSDNQAGFFVEGIVQANKLEKLLNDDPVLMAKATSMGYEVVAVAIHSQLSSAEQERRFNAYKAGKYLAVVGDEKFKEGFDHAPMKTIIDSPHTSVVDKAQILGRGLRKWWNEKKQRFEGLTIIDTILYMGHVDPDKDEIFKNAAKRKSVSVKSILEESYILSPDAPPEKPGTPGGGGGGDVFKDDPDVEEYTNLESIFELEDEISKLKKEHLIEITSDMLNKLESEINRTNLKSTAIVNGLGDNPSGVGVGHIEGWRNGIRTAIPEYWNAVIAFLGKSPTVSRIDITDDALAELKAEIDRTRLGAVAIYSILGSEFPELSAGKIASWYKGTVKTAEQKEWFAVLNYLKNKPTIFEITKENRSHLKAEIARTYLGPSAITDEFGGRFHNINVSKIESWCSGSIITAELKQWETILEYLKNSPDAFKITDAMQTQLKSEMERTGLGSTSIVAGINAEVRTISSGKIDTWRSGRSTIANPDEWNAVISFLQNAPDLFKITDERRAELTAEIYRTGLGPNSIVEKLGSNPSGISVSKIKHWCGGRVETADPKQWQAMMACLKNSPDIFRITDDAREQLKAEMDRTNLRARSIVSRLQIKDEKIPGVIDRWCEGKTSTASSSLWHTIIEFLKSQPDCKPGKRPARYTGPSFSP